MTPTLAIRRRADHGFSIAETMIATAVLLIIFSAVTGALLQLANAHRRTWNRTEMHSGVRGATELLQQEVGQAGRVALPGTVTTTTAVGAYGSQNFTVTSSAGMFVGEQIIVDSGPQQETVTITAIAGNQLTASFLLPGGLTHNIGSNVMVLGGFATGIVPPSLANGSTGSVLKLYGDINGDGSMVYVEYKCDTTAHNLYRNVMAWNAAAKPAVTNAQVLLANIIANPGGTACFTYQTSTVGTATYVTDVAITLTVQTQLVDPTTKQFQTETKALLNVSPRNVFNVWELASIGLTNRVQPMPPSILALLP